MGTTTPESDENPQVAKVIDQVESDEKQLDEEAERLERQAADAEKNLNDGSAWPEQK